MTDEVQLGTRTIPFALVSERGSWHSIEEVAESEFPLVTFIDGKRYELYSDAKFAEVEKSDCKT